MGGAADSIATRNQVSVALASSGLSHPSRPMDQKAPHHARR